MFIKCYGNCWDVWHISGDAGILVRMEFCKRQDSEILLLVMMPKRVIL